MADFKEAFDKTMGHEGGYVNDPNDAGGETYKGVARRYNPDWNGWGIIDQLKDAPNFPKNLDDSQPLQDAVKALYKQKYWNPFWGDEIPDQDIAEELFDTGVNMGTGRAIKFLQQGLNLLNRNGKLYGDIVEDGDFGQNTFDALTAYLSGKGRAFDRQKDKPDLLLKIMNILQGMHYINYMRKSPTQEKYARGWLKRVKISKS
ncbi:MAG: glycoside hydrolase family 108 protein [bacterium]